MKNYRIYKILKNLYLLYISLKNEPDRQDAINIVEELNSLFETNTNDYKSDDFIKNFFLIIKKSRFNQFGILYYLKGLKKFNQLSFKWFIENLVLFKKSFEIIIKYHQEMELKKVALMASTMHNHPDFLLNNYFTQPLNYWNNQLSYYKRTFNDDVFGFFKERFFEYYKLETSPN